MRLSRAPSLLARFVCLISGHTYGPTLLAFAECDRCGRYDFDR
jgi:hypothetical protein